MEMATVHLDISQAEASTQTGARQHQGAGTSLPCCGAQRVESSGVGAPAARGPIWRAARRGGAALIAIRLPPKRKESELKIKPDCSLVDVTRFVETGVANSQRQLTLLGLSVLLVSSEQQIWSRGMAPGTEGRDFFDPQTPQINLCPISEIINLRPKAFEVQLERRFQEASRPIDTRVSEQDCSQRFSFSA